MIMMPTTDPGHHCSSQVRQTSGTPQGRENSAEAERFVVGMSADGQHPRQGRQLTTDPRARRDTRAGVLHVHCLSCVRDLAATLQRHGIEPIIAVPELSAALLHIGTRTAHVPRDAILHYSAFNPSGERRRRFSDNLQEDMLIDAITVGADSIVAAIWSLRGALRMDFASAEFLQRCNIAERNLSRLVSAMAGVVKSVRPEFFASKLRPHWEPILVGGTRTTDRGRSNCRFTLSMRSSGQPTAPKILTFPTPTTT